MEYDYEVTEWQGMYCEVERIGTFISKSVHDDFRQDSYMYKHQPVGGQAKNRKKRQQFSMGGQPKLIVENRLK